MEWGTPPTPEMVAVEHYRFAEDTIAYEIPGSSRLSIAGAGFDRVGYVYEDNRLARVQAVGSPRREELEGVRRCLTGLLGPPVFDDDVYFVWESDSGRLELAVPPDNSLWSLRLSAPEQR